MQLLIRSKEPLTDDGGKVFGTSLVRLIMNFAAVEGSLQTVSMGSEWSVSFCLQQGDSITHYRGFPNFILRKDVGVGAAFVITGVCESQSNLKDPVLQGGIYAVGELRKRESKNKVTCISLRKNKSINILVAELETESTTSSLPCMGSVSYKRDGYNST